VSNSLLSRVAALAAASMLATVTYGAEVASATISSMQSGPGSSQYNLALNNTGTTTLGTFWFSWIPGDNFMPVSPTGITSPGGWQDMVTHGGPSNGFAIQWTAKTPANDLAAGSSLTGFSFDSSLTSAQLESPSTGHPSDPVATAFVYRGAPFSDPGFQLTAAQPGATTPEPSNFLLGAFGLGVLLVRRTYCKRD
jgi:hypothetical protein